MLRRFLSWTIGRAVDIVRYVVLQLMIASSARTTVAGFDVADLISRGDSQARFRKLGEALALIESAQPSLMRRVRSSIERIVFLESGPEYWPRARACILHDVTNLSATQVALIIVHEATHGRLWRAGIRYGPAVRERVERICVRAELALLPNLPSGANFVEHTRQKLSSEWWSDEQRKERHAEVIADVEAPAWMLRAYRSVMRRKLPDQRVGKSGK